ncbi:DUF4342 domain-containing protein [Sporosalibacterium faouarense]|uniref:DUF4342 domain-containing protein n=1 Tax=Sporosalibacterium faouarense TaxID=516123 RepID=UPI00192C99A2|nr:DUF4342 domain-containing protein [Sporosalibacterium faouarense]
MDINLEKIDTIRARTGVSYKEAKEVLEKCDGDVVDALIHLEENQKSWGQNFSKNVSSKTDAIMENLKEALKKGNVTKIVVRRDGNVIMNIPVTAGAIGAIISPPVTAVGLTAAIVAKCTIEIVKENGETVNINDMTEKTMDKMKNAMRRDKDVKTEDNMENDDSVE